MRVGLFFGSFNPIHVGHMIIANLVHESSDIDEVWFVVSPQNPFKKSKNLLHEFDRLDMVNAAIGKEYHFRASDIEFGLPKPSYTINTLVHLSEKHQDKEFKLIIGGDNLVHFPKWKNYEQILEYYGLIVYPRPGADIEQNELLAHKNVSLIKAPIMDISATLIRELIRSNKSVRYMVPDAVADMIDSKGFFR